MEINYRFGTISKISLVSVALVCDIAGIILLFFAVGALINTFLGIFFTLYSSLIFLLIGVPLFSGRRLKVWGSSMLIEIFPFLNAVPALTISMVWLIYQTNKEDEALVAQKTNTVQLAEYQKGQEDIKINNNYRRAA